MDRKGVWNFEMFKFFIRSFSSYPEEEGASSDGEGGGVELGGLEKGVRGDAYEDFSMMKYGGFVQLVRFILAPLLCSKSKSTYLCYN